MALVLRDYQAACIKKHFSYFQFKKGNPLFVLPTGAGKSLVIAEFIRETLNRWPNQRILVLTHVKELIEQNYNEFMDQWGELLAPVGIYSAGMDRRDTDCSVIFAGIQSAWPSTVNENPSRSTEVLGRFDLVLIDECHLLPKSGMGRYRSYLEYLKSLNPHLKILGYTATPFRLDGGLLHKGPGRIFTDIAYEVPLKKLIDEGYLCNLVAKLPEKVIDTSGVGSAVGDFKKGELQLAAMSGNMVTDAVNEMIFMAKKDDRKHWLVFACGVEHAEEILAQVRSNGIKAEAIFGNTKKDERKRIVDEAKAGKITCLVNVGVLTTGFNWRRCDLLAMMRPTQSVALYVQIMGRAMRTFPGKKNALVLDYGENVLRHGPINDIVIFDEGRRKKGDPPEGKTCPACQSIVALGTKVCPDCGTEFEVSSNDPNHDRRAGGASPINFAPKVKPKHTLTVHGISYKRHTKEGKPDSFKVTYQAGMRQYNEWICLEHTGFALRKAQQFWKSRGELPVPTTVSEALERVSELKKPSQIIVQEDGKYERVIDYKYGDIGSTTTDAVVEKEIDQAVGRCAFRADADG